MAKQKFSKPKNFDDEIKRERYFKKRTKKIDRVEKLFDSEEYLLAIRRAQPLLRLGVADAYISALNACAKIKAVRVAERIVRFGLRQGKLKPELLYELLSEVYLSVNDIENYHKLILQIREIRRKKEESLERFTS